MLMILSRGMQDCFRQHPDVYGAELEDDEEAPGAPAPEQQPAAAEAAELSESETLVPKAAHDAGEKSKAA